MGYYKCPRCGGRDNYKGNVVLNRNGATFTREMGDSGVYASASTRGSTYTEKVLKCRDCNEILSDDDYIKSKKEKEEERQGEIVATVIIFAIFCIWIVWWAQSKYAEFKSYGN